MKGEATRQSSKHAEKDAQERAGKVSGACGSGEAGKSWSTSGRTGELRGRKREVREKARATALEGRARLQGRAEAVTPAALRRGGAL